LPLAAAACPVKREKSVVFPERGRPRIPNSMAG
jgi:hypothetical protein